MAEDVVDVGGVADDISSYDFAKDTNLLVYCGYCIDSFQNGTLEQTLSDLANSTEEEQSYDNQLEDYTDDLESAEVANANDTEDYQLCDFSKKLDSVFLDRAILVPAAILIIIFAFLLRRKFKHLNVLNGRPGFVYPVNLLEGQQHRFSFVAAFVLVSWTMIEMVIPNSQSTGLQFYEEEMYPNMKAFYVLAAGIMRALEFYPIFAALTSNTVVGFGLCSFYVWALLIMFFIDDRFCFSKNKSIMAIEMARLVPPAFCLFYLSIYMPYRFFKTCCCKRETEEKIWQQSYNVLYVKELMNRQKHRQLPPSTLFEKIKAKTYNPTPKFKFSISILTSSITGLVFAYMTLLQFLKTMYDALEKGKQGLRFALKASKAKGPMKVISVVVAGYFEVDEKKGYLIIVREGLFWMLTVIEPIVYLSLTLAFLSVCLSMLLTLKNYRTNLFAIYKNDHDEIERRDAFKPRGLIIAGVKFIGYQIAYAAWGFIIQAFILMGIFMFIASLLIFLFRYKWYFIYFFLRDKLWCMLVTLVFLMLVQNLMAHFLFLRKGDNGERVLALDNRRVFFNYHYFAVFTNIAIGLLSCILRIFRAVFFGLWTVTRLDMSTLSRDFERLDAGYMSYISLLYLEHNQRNPTMLVFMSVLLKSSNTKEDRMVQVSAGDLKKKMPLQNTNKFKRARNRWQLFLTLERNPAVRLYRKNGLGSIPIAPPKTVSAWQKKEIKPVIINYGVNKVSYQEK